MKKKTSITKKMNKMISFFVIFSLFVIFDLSASFAVESDSSASEGRSSELLKIYFVSPFEIDSENENAVSSRKFSFDFDSFRQKFSISEDYEQFNSVINSIMARTGLCSDVAEAANSSRGAAYPEILLKNCFNYQPDEAFALANMVNYYLKWKDSKLKQILEYYGAKANSTRLIDRIESKLFFLCLKNQTTEPYQAVEICRQPQNYSFSELWPQLNECSQEFNQASNREAEFSLREFVENCIAKDFLSDYENNPGAKAAVELIMESRISISENGLEIELEPLKVKPKLIFEMIRARTEMILNSDWYNRLVTKGCIPSIFSPLDLSNKDNKDLFYSVCIPPEIVQKISALPRADAEFYRSVLALKIATLQTLELLSGAEMIALEAERYLAQIDSDLAQLAYFSRILISNMRRQYKDSIDMAYVTKLEDVLSAVEELYDLYRTEKQRLAHAADSIKAELIRQRYMLKEGYDEIRIDALE